MTDQQTFIAGAVDARDSRCLTTELGRPRDCPPSSIGKAASDARSPTRPDQPLASRRVLYIGVGYFGYDKLIADGLRALGAEVTAVSERPDILLRSHFSSPINVVPPLRKLVQRHHESRLKSELRGKVFDLVLVIKGDSLDVSFYDFLRSEQPNAAFILYQWDSINRVRGFYELRKRFDRCLTFDRHDAEREEDLVFRPLFFCHSSGSSGQAQNGLVFVGSLHSTRLRAVHLLRNQARLRGLSFRIYIRVGLFSFIRLLCSRQLKDAYYRPLPYSMYLHWTDEAEAVVDLPHPLQTGLTMRTIEAIGLGKKIITTNTDIRNYEFYDSKYICIIDANNPVIPDRFLNGTRAKYSAKTLQQLSLRQWLLDVLDLQPLSSAPDEAF